MLRDLPRRKTIWVFVVFIILYVVLIYGRTYDFSFISIDDAFYVNKNEYVKPGLTFAGVKWALLARHAANWHPVTWISHMVDVSLFGMNPGAMHLVNAGLHLANALLLFWALNGLFGDLVVSGVLALLFAIHPAHVESVAWISERKDVLCSLFWFLGLIVWERHARRGGRAPYLLVLAIYAIGLASKPMLVTFPFVLLLLDHWPLDRFRRVPGTGWKGWLASNRWILLEKVPLLVMSLITCALTIWAQSGMKAIRSLEAYSIPIRIANAGIAYAKYLIMMVAPHQLAFYYPHPGAGFSRMQLILSVLVLGGITGLAIRWRHSRPYLIVGWGWYLITLVPVIGLVQVGGQALADRYTYIPYIGPGMILVYGAKEAIQRYRVPQGVYIGLGVVYINALLVLSGIQVGYWKTDLELFTRSAKVSPSSLLARKQLGGALFYLNSFDEALEEFQKADSINPDNGETKYLLALTQYKLGHRDEAMQGFEAALKLDPGCVPAHFYLGNLYMERRDYSAAIASFERFLGGDPSRAIMNEEIVPVLLQNARVSLGVSLCLTHEQAKGIARFDEAIQFDPKLGIAYVYKGVALAELKRYGEAVKCFETGLALKPVLGEDTYLAIGDAMLKAGRKPEARGIYQDLLRTFPDSREARVKLAELGSGTPGGRHDQR